MIDRAYVMQPSRKLKKNGAQKASGLMNTSTQQEGSTPPQPRGTEDPALGTLWTLSSSSSCSYILYNKLVNGSISLSSVRYSRKL